jgi:effector-binding domain-containing protein
MAHAVSIVATSATPTAVIRETTTWERFPTLWGELLDEVWAHVRGAGVRAGRNMMLYLDDVPTVEVGVELEGALTTPSGRIVASALPEGRAATTAARGAPSRQRLDAAHAAVVEWSRANGHELTGTRWEVYDHWRDDPESFETAVYWLLAS